MASYLRPTSLQHALEALAAQPRTILAGGTDHYPARTLHEPPEDILDISALEGLRQIARVDHHWRIPALATWTDLIDHRLPTLFDGLKAAASQIGGRQIQNAGTIAGNLCNASPAADGIPPLLALDAAVELRSAATSRVLPLSDFILGPRHTARRPDELLTAILIPHLEAISTFEKLGARKYLVISVTMVATTIATDPAGRIVHAAIAVGACGPVATRLPALEAALLGNLPSPGLLQAHHLAPLHPIDDLRAPAAYRLQATLELLRRALTPAQSLAA
jgi:CO/xanthine dehydrogenase FAD-binding subunit